MNLLKGINITKHVYLFIFVLRTTAIALTVPFASTLDLEVQVNLYCSNSVDLDVKKYGTIDNWNVSQITDMSYLFLTKTSCNPNISAWDVSSVTDFHYMFHRASSFNHDIGNWDVSKGIDFHDMFWEATSFNQDIGGWDVSGGIKFGRMFSQASSFNQNISSWNVSNGTQFYDMFNSAVSFNQDISSWDVSGGVYFDSMFDGAISFNQNLSRWDIFNGKDFNNMFYNTTSFFQNLSTWMKHVDATNPAGFCSGGICVPYAVVTCGRSDNVGKKKCKVHERICDRNKVKVVRCCSDTRKPKWKKRLGCSVWANSKIFGTCHRKKTWFEAKYICNAGGGRLCTTEEVVNDCTRGTGCGFDVRMIWVSSVMKILT